MPCNPENRLLVMQQCPELRDWVYEQATNQELYRVGAEKEIQGNS